MNTLVSIIQNLSSSERATFLLQLKKKNKRHDTKNIQLFKLLEQDVVSSDLSVLLYGKKATGAFHALCKRLHDSLIEFIATQNFASESSEEFEILKFLMASRVFFEQKQYNIAFKTLRKAEQQALKFNLYAILNEVYYTKIQYAHHNTKLEVTEIITQQKANKIALQHEENLNIFYAMVQNQLSKDLKSTEKIIRENLSNFNISISESLDHKSLYKILEIVTQKANINRDYGAVLDFVEDSYRALNVNSRKADKQLFYHIQVLYYVANAYFRNRNFNASDTYLQLMHVQMQEQQNKYYARFTPQYTLLKSLVLNYSSQAEKAIALLTSFNFAKHTNQLSYILDLQLSLVVFYFQQSEFKLALGGINQFQHSDQWYAKKASTIWVIKKALIDILLHIELDHFEVVASKIKSFQKKYTSVLKQRKETKVLHFISCINQFYFNLKNPKTSKEFEKLTQQLDTQKEDLFILSFYAWLNARINKLDLYTTTLQLIRR
ncbi:hypothetical protein [Aquimarina agarivorans]|uniref:hypothetical protein n=1 Tax=Aquimarina agarivorans TaxID=980584 RepID=UPI000248EFCC|nr:hypothetical protein [Aquimarina agarivorans]